MSQFEHHFEIYRGYIIKRAKVRNWSNGGVSKKGTIYVLKDKPDATDADIEKRVQFTIYQSDKDIQYDDNGDAINSMDVAIIKAKAYVDSQLDNAEVVNDPMSIDNIKKILKDVQFDLAIEKVTQQQIKDRFDKYKIPYTRECFLSEGNVIDFLLTNGLGIEIKIKGDKKKIYDQLYRYSSHKEVTAVLLITNKHIGTAPLYENKPMYVMSLSAAYT